MGSIFIREGKVHFLTQRETLKWVVQDQQEAGGWFVPGLHPSGQRMRHPSSDDTKKQSRSLVLSDTGGQLNQYQEPPTYRPSVV